MADEVSEGDVQANADSDSGAGGDGASQQTDAKVDGSGWIKGFISRFQHPDDREPVSSGAAKTEDEGSDEEKGEDGKPKEPAKPADGQPFKVFATQEEYDAEAKRLGQAESDRREAARARRDAEEARKQLRRDDPERAIQLEDEAEQAVAATRETASSVIDIYDSAIIAPILGLIEDEEKRAEIAGTVSSVETRMAAIKSVVEHLTAEAEKAGIEKGKKMARANGAVHKEVMRTIRAESDEPELVESGASNGHKMTPNQWMRRQLGYRDE